jgi:putative FmdB family regulatory protein
MPLYEYECENGHRFEVIQKFSDPLVDKCPTCGSPVRKLISSPAFQFKGTGWYVTDYARKDSGGGKPPSSATEGAGTGSESKKSETTTPAAGSTSTAPATPAKKD